MSPEAISELQAREIKWKNTNPFIAKKRSAPALENPRGRWRKCHNPRARINPMKRLGRKGPKGNTSTKAAYRAGRNRVRSIAMGNGLNLLPPVELGEFKHNDDRKDDFRILQIILHAQED